MKLEHCGKFYGLFEFNFNICEGAMLCGLWMCENMVIKEFEVVIIWEQAGSDVLLSLLIRRFSIRTKCVLGVIEHIMKKYNEK